MSAHRMPHEMLAYGEEAAGRGLRVIIAGAGGAAHLPGMLASVTPLPVIGVPVPLSYLDGMDSLLSIVQMPAGVPVATVAVGGARNAGLLAVRILAASDAGLQEPDGGVPGRPRDKARAKGETAAPQRGGGDGLRGLTAGQPAGPSRGHSMAGQRSMTMSRPAAVTRSEAASSITSSWNQTALAPIAIAWSAMSPASDELTKTSTTSTGNGMSASVA